MKKVSVVVLGDIGRSPRMQYHAMSLAKEGFLVRIIGYKGSSLIDELSSNDNVKVVYVRDCPNFKKHVTSGLAYILKTVFQAITLLIALISAGASDFLLVQNPPAIPSLGVCYLFSRITRCTFMIDWHNYAYSILALSFEEENDNRLVRWCKAFEFWIGRRSDWNICVTRAMKDNLMEEHGIKATTLYDRPPESFRPITVEEKHELFRALGKSHAVFIRDCFTRETIFTRLDSNGEVSLKKNRPGLLISSTSWTKDEDFSLLLEALQDYEEAKEKKLVQLPHLLVVITGKGPLKNFYIEVMAQRHWKHIDFITPWLAPEEYPRFLASGDLGVSLHYSSSGLDLPMKVVDMFGCGLPVCAVNFKCLGELVMHKQNGLVFENSSELSEQLIDWFTNFPDVTEKTHWQSKLRDNLESFRSLRWHANWILNVKPLFT